MARKPPVDTAVLTVRVPLPLERRLAREARRRRQTRSALAREILETALRDATTDLKAQARRQSVLVSRRQSESDILDFLVGASDFGQWK